MLRYLKSLFNRGQQLPATSRSNEPYQSTRFALRGGELVQADGVFDAWTSRDLNKMLKVLDKKTSLVDRHFLLMTIVDESYKLRKTEPDMRELCARISEQHLEEFPEIKPTLVDANGLLPRVTTFQKYATLLAEQGDYDRAIEVCETALSYGLKDKTKSGFEGRIQRIRKASGK